MLVSEFWTAYVSSLRRSRLCADKRWHPDEVFVSINGRRIYLWRAVDSEGEVLDILVPSRWKKKDVLKLIHKLLKKTAFAPRCNHHR
jgi:transposase-like protein